MFDFEADVTRISSAAYKAGTVVKINSILPTVSVDHGNGESYFFQEHQATQLLLEVELAISGYNISEEDYIAYISQGW